MATGVVNIEGTDYDIYGTQEDALEYLQATTYGQAWVELDDDAQAKALVTATRFLDRQRWMGEKTSPTQPLEWPRTGVVDKYGDPVDSSTPPIEIEHATYELALLFYSGSRTILDSVNSGSNIQSVRAGSASVTFFGSSTRTAGRFPTLIQELIGQFLAGAGVGLGVFVSGISESRYTTWDLGLTGGGLA